MDLFNNPFYILGATTKDKKTEINRLANEKSLSIDAEECAQARTTLTNPNKRISAEIGWFPGESIETIELIINYLISLKDRKKTNIYFNVNKLHPIAKLNILKEMIRHTEHKSILDILLPKFKHQREENYHNAGKYEGLTSLIFEVDKGFEEIDPYDVMEVINQERLLSGFPQIEDQFLIEDELKKVRQEINGIIEEMFTKISPYSRVKVVNNLAEKCFNNENTNRGVIIDNIIDSHELRNKDLMEQQASDIVSLAENIQNKAGPQLNSMVDYLIKKVGEFDILAQPLQLKARSEGMTHKESEKVAWAIRTLAIILHNQHHETEQAIKITNALDINFAELPEVAEIIQKDIKALNDIQQKQQKEKAEYDRMIAENLADREYTITVKGNRVFIPPLCTCCLTPTENKETISSVIDQGYFSRTIRTFSLGFPICSNCQAHRKQISIKKWILIISSLLIPFITFVILRDMMLDYYTVAVIYVMLTIAAYLLIGYYIRLPLLTPEHSSWEESVSMRHIEKGNTVIFQFTNWRYATFFAEANSSQCVAIKNRSKIKGNTLISSLAHPIIIFVIIVAISLGVTIFVGPSLSQESTSTQNYAAPKPSSTNYSSRQIKINNLKSELDTRLGGIKRMEDELSDMQHDLEHYEYMFNQTHNNSYANQYNSLRVEYQALLDNYDSALNQYNELVSEYNKLIGQ